MEKNIQRDIADMVYLATEIEQIKHDFEESETNQTLDDFAMSWIELNGESYARKHNRQ